MWAQLRPINARLGTLRELITLALSCGRSGRPDQRVVPRRDKE
jgi:hypothetical protein